jgi:DNA modification methylase
VRYQLSLFPFQDIETVPEVETLRPGGIRERLSALLAGDLDFRGAETGYASHRFHSFAAKFPPQLPRLFIQNLTEVGDTVLDPMAGSGTTVVEAALLGRRGVGVDLDPLAVQIGRAKTTGVLWEDLSRAARRTLIRAHQWLQADRSGKLREFRSRLNDATRDFLDYWFLPSTQEELAALMAAIREEPHPGLRRLMLLAFSSTIVTKSGGVSLARDLAHSRPHRDPEKRPASALDLFRERIQRYRQPLLAERISPGDALILHGDARSLPLGDQSVHLIVTSPPYANAIDYMRAHKFSLVWMGRPIDELGQWRSRYIGAERTQEDEAILPSRTWETVQAIAEYDPRRARVLQRYFTDMRRAIQEMYRVLRPGAAAVIVVGPSMMRGVLVETHLCLAEIAESEGFDLVGIGERRLDRDRRMMPVSAHSQSRSSIELRMHNEYVIGLVKPEER